MILLSPTLQPLTISLLYQYRRHNPHETLIQRRTRIAEYAFQKLSKGLKNIVEKSQNEKSAQS